MKLKATLLILSIFGGFVGCTNVKTTTASATTTTPAAEVTQTESVETNTAEQVDLPDAAALADIEIVPEEENPETTDNNNAEDPNANAVLEIDAPEITS